MTSPLVGARHVVLPRVDSTNAEAVRRVTAGEPTPFWLLAETQTEGRGRQGRSWQSPAGNLCASLVFFTDLAPAQAAHYSFVACLAVGDLFASLAPAADVSFKWPNDALLNGAKAAGVLLETLSAPCGARALVVGIGVNLATSPAGLIREAGAPPPTSIPEMGGRRASPGEALALLAEAFGAWDALFRAQGFDPIREAWMARAARLKQPIRARLAQEVVDGVFESVDAKGCLVLRTADGPRRIAAGDVHFPE